MRYLIRFLTRGPAGGIETHDRTYQGEAVTLGRATDQVLHLKDRRVGLQHARIEPKGERFHIVTTALAGITVNGRSCREAVLETGDQISMGANLLTVIEPPPGFDFAFTFELDPDAEPLESTTDRQRLSLSASGWSKRRWSWAAALAVLGATLLIPAVSLFAPESAGWLRETPLPSDRWWAAGPVHIAHGGEAAECQSCHVTPFQRVRDAQCLACHTADRHVDTAEPALAVLGATRCASCHVEHNEPAILVESRQQLCGDCHRDIAAEAASLAADVEDFGIAHPEFRVSLLQPVAVEDGIDWEVVRSVLTGAAGQDRSNLRFPHADHLDPNGINSPDGDRILDCGDCHVPEPGGALMQPISMEQHCSGCHTLSFDPADPEREVPHGAPGAVVQELIEYYSARLLGGEAQSEGRVILRPGQALTAAERDRAAAEAEQQAMTVAADLFERRACATCHEVSSDADASPPYRIEPVRLTQQFFPHARFSHEAHDAEIASCGDCHAAETSEASGDVLMPGIDSCRDCHGSGITRRNQAGQMPTTCIVCHSFHSAAKGEYP